MDFVRIASRVAQDTPTDGKHSVWVNGEMVFEGTPDEARDFWESDSANMTNPGDVASLRDADDIAISRTQVTPDGKFEVLFDHAYDQPSA